MAIIDPLKPLEGGPLHRVDIAVAESITGVRGRSISRHMVEPAVQAGARPSDAIAVLHWGMIGVGVVAAVAAAAAAVETTMSSTSRRRG